MVEKVNSIADPEHYRAIIGAEKSATPYRIVTEIRNADLDEMNEPVLINLHQGFIHATRAQADGWRHKAGRFYHFWKKPKFRERSRRWRAGQHALQNVDATWGSIIGAYKMKKDKSRRFLSCVRNDYSWVGGLPMSHRNHLIFSPT